MAYETYRPYRSKDSEPILLSELQDVQLQCQLANWQHHQLHSPHIIDGAKLQLIIDLENELCTRDIPQLGHRGIMSNFVEVEQLPEPSKRNNKRLALSKASGRITGGH